MNGFNKLPGFVRSAPGLEQRIWVRLPAIWLWGTLLPLVLVGLDWGFALLAAPSDGSAQLLRSYTMIGVVVLHGSLVLTLGLGCFIVKVMKGPAYVADAYPLPSEITEPTTRP
jgi:hypothetical protein